MQLNTWRRNKNLTYEELGRSLGISTSKAFRLCNKKEYQEKITLRDAQGIKEKTAGEVGLEDLLAPSKAN